MNLPVLDSVSGAWVADKIEEMLNKCGIQSVTLVQSVPVPNRDAHLGGVTKVPFLVWWIHGRGAVLIEGDQGSQQPQWRRLSPGDCVLAAPGSYVQLRHGGTSDYLRATVDTDHVLVGQSHIARAVDPNDLDDWQPMRGCILAKVPSPELIWRSLDSTLEVPHRQALVQAWWWEVTSALRQRTRDGRSQATWSAMRAWVDAHAQRGVTRSDVAKAFGVHPQQVSRLFQRFAGATFAATELRSRLEQARTSLTDPQRSVAEIAEACRFSSPSHFVRSFREVFGVTPGVWRRRKLSASG